MMVLNHLEKLIIIHFAHVGSSKSLDEIDRKWSDCREREWQAKNILHQTSLNISETSFEVLLPYIYDTSCFPVISSHGHKISRR